MPSPPRRPPGPPRVPPRPLGPGGIRVPPSVFVDPRPPAAPPPPAPDPPPAIPPAHPDKPRDPLVDPRTWQEAVTALARNELHNTSLHWRYGRILIAIHDFGLWKEPQRWKTFLDWLAAEAPYTEQHCRKLAWFARAFHEEKDAAQIGITRGIELLNLCELTGQDPAALVRTNALIDGRPLAQHTRASLIAARKKLEAAMNTTSPDVADDDAAPDPSWVRPEVVTTPPAVMRYGQGIARRLERHFHHEGAAGAFVTLVSHEGRPELRMCMPLDDAPKLMD